MSPQPSALCSSSQRYDVYRVWDILELKDPDIPGPRYHNKIFVETSSDGTGIVHHVTGDLVQGMTHESKAESRPESSASFYSKDFLGTILASAYPGNIDATLQALPPPSRQKAFNVKTMKTEPVKPDGTFYTANEQRPPLFKCTEWTEQGLEALQKSGVLEATWLLGNAMSRHLS